MTSRLLCIDDEPDVVTWVGASMLRHPDAWEVAGAGTLAEAAAAYAAQAADVVLLDLGLPDVTGHALEGLREVLTWRPQPAVVVMTGSEDRVLGMLAVDAGAQDYLTKRTVSAGTIASAVAYARRRHAATFRTAARADVADERADALAAYASSVSHDLRSPIATLLMLAEATERAIEDSAEDPAASLVVLERLTRNMSELAGRALRFCDGLLTDAQQASDDREEVDLMAIVSDATQLAIAGNREGLSVEIEELPTGLWGQEGSLRQAVLNLMLNASRHTPRPGGRIAIHASVAEDRLTLVVEDNGPGIASADRHDIFASGISGSGSTGLGLATVQRVVERHGGRVWIEDGPRLGGAAFMLELPWRRPRSDAGIDAHGHPRMDGGFAPLGRDTLQVGVPSEAGGEPGVPGPEVADVADTVPQHGDPLDTDTEREA